MVKVFMGFENKNYSFDELVDIVRILRAPGGCPWDAEQTHESIRNDFIEETYEVADAIDRKNKTDLCEELGDVLLQVIFHSQIAREDNDFSIEDVINGIANKMVLRHPHVFGDVTVENTEEVLKNWDAIKKTEKNQTSCSDTLKSVPTSFPALMRASKVQKRAGKAGVIVPDAAASAEKIEALAKDLRAAVSSGETEKIGEMLGELYFAVCLFALPLKINSEEMLSKKTEEFISKFEKTEKENGELKNLLL